MRETSGGSEPCAATYRRSRSAKSSTPRLNVHAEEHGAKAAIKLYDVKRISSTFLARMPKMRTGHVGFYACNFECYGRWLVSIA